MIRLLIVHRTRMECELFSAVLRNERDVQVVGYAYSSEEALEEIEKQNCNLVLVHFALPNNDALHLASALYQAESDVKVVVAGVVDSSALIVRCAEEGVAGFVLEEDSLADLVKKLRAVHEGTAIVSPNVASALMDRVAELKRLSNELYGLNLCQADDLFAQLTPREWDVLHLVVRGYNNQQIASELVIEKGTAKNHIHSILSKLDVHTRGQAALLATHLLSGQQEDAATPTTFVPTMSMNGSSRATALSQ